MNSRKLNVFGFLLLLPVLRSSFQIIICGIKFIQYVLAKINWWISDKHPERISYFIVRIENA